MNESLPLTKLGLPPALTQADHDKEVVKLAKTQGAEIIDASQVDATVRTARSRARRTWGRG